MRRALTLIEILIVIAIVSILAAFLIPVFERAKQASKKTTCLANMHQIGMGNAMYLDDNDGRFPQTKDSSDQPDVDDIDGSIDEPDYASFFDLLNPYANGWLRCPEDVDPSGANCQVMNPDTPAVTSFLVNGYLVFGLKEASIQAPSNLIEFAERRSDASEGLSPFCDYLYHPWFSALNPKAPEDQMDAATGAIATSRHEPIANYVFTDAHAKGLLWKKTYSPPAIDLHRP